MIRLDVAISTYGPHGLERVSEQILPRVEGVEYVVAWQNHCNAPVPQSIADRGDINVFRFEGKGLSVNRNNSISSCTADLILISDDDIRFDASGLRSLQQLYSTHPDIDLCTLVLSRPGKHIWPSEMMQLHRKYPKGYSVCSCELSFRKSRIGTLRFNPEFGINAPKMQCGEEELFLHTAIMRGLSCWFAPIKIGDHPEESTGNRHDISKGILMGHGCILRILYPYSYILRIPLKAYRTSKSSSTGFLKALRHLAAGALAGSRMIRNGYLSQD